MKTITTTFQEIPSYGEGNKRCCECNKYIRKRFKAYQTINPWNNKSPSEIRQENAEKLSVIIPEWESKEEKCASCLKQDIPDIEIDYISKSEWDLTQDLRDEISTLKKQLSEKEKVLGSQFKGRHLKVFYKKQERIGQVTSLWDGDNFSYDIVRSDLKGITEQSDYNNASRLFKD